MLKIKSPLYRLITILFRQMNLSVGRYSNKEDFYAYFINKHRYYQYVIAELDKILYQPLAYSSFFEMIYKSFFVKKVKYLHVLILYKTLKEFDEMLYTKDFDYMTFEKKVHITSGVVYWDLLRKNIPRKERKIIDETEHFGQNLMFSHYTSIEETLKRLDIKIEVDEDGNGSIFFV